MANITTENRADFAKKADAIKKEINLCQEKEKNMLASMRKDSTGVEYKKITLAEEMIYISNLYLYINTQ